MASGDVGRSSMHAGTRPRITFAIAAALLAVTAAVAYGAHNVIQPSNVSASPKSFCLRAADSCAGIGTTIRFTIAEPAKVTAHIRPRSSNILGYRVVRRDYAAGTRTFRITDRRLTTGRWTVNIQAVNSVGAGPPRTVDVRVIK
jgi:hypothetical protein